MSTPGFETQAPYLFGAFDFSGLGRYHFMIKRNNGIAVMCNRQ